VFAQARRSSLAIAALGAALLVTACTSGDSGAGGGGGSVRLPNTVTVGLLTAKSGPDAATGVEAIRGAELAIDVVNNSYPQLPLALGPSDGLSNGVKLALSVGDTQGAPERVDEQVSKLINDGALGVVLADDLEVARSASRKVDIAGIAMVDATSTADLFGDLNSTGHFRIQPSDRSAVQATMAFLFSQRAGGETIGKLAVFGPKATASGNEEVEAIRQAISDLGQADGYLPGPALALGAGGSSTDDLAAAVDSTHSDVAVAIVTGPQDLAAAADLAARLEGRTPVFAVGPAAGGADSAKVAKTTLLRTVSYSAEYTARNPVAVQVAKLYTQRYGGRITALAASAFTATMTMAMSIDRAKTLSAGDVRGAAQQLSVPATQTIMPWDGIRFDGNGNNELAASVIEQRTASGFQVVHPRELATAKIAWP
jgi:branched-chain amino acid transport system substrate-binding protein